MATFPSSYRPTKNWASRKNRYLTIDYNGPSVYDYTQEIKCAQSYGLEKNGERKDSPIEANHQHKSSQDPKLKHTVSKIINRQRSRYEKPINAIWELFSDYSNGASIHGVRYLGEKRRHWSERLWWIIAFSLSLFALGKLILNTWYKWNEFPVIVTFAEKSTPIWEIPFPAVTICPQVKARQTVLNYTALYYKQINRKDLSDKEKLFLTATSNVCETRLMSSIMDENLTTTSLYQQLNEVAPSLTSLMYDCIFKQKKCRRFFRNTWTEDGLCFTFNILNSSELYREEILDPTFKTVIHNFSSKNWNLNMGYQKNDVQDIYPFRVFGANDGLRLNLRLFEMDFDYLCSGPVQGFKLLLHSPEDIPQIAQYYYRIPLDNEVILSVKPNLMNTSETLRNYNPERRQCFFESERHLKYFKIYTQRNCELECITNATVKRCGCVSFAMPREIGVPICDLSMFKCFKTAELKANKRNAAGNCTGCNCLPACSSISYDAELSFAKYDLREVQNAKGKVQAYKKQYAQIFISFKENQIFASRRSELYGTADFYANCGGLLGLFMGVSILSVVEMVYYCTLRLGCNIRTRLKAKRKRQRQMVKRESENLLKF